MKKITVILLLFCYIIPAFGLSVKQHWCSGKLASISFIFTNSPSCKCGKKTMKKDCCKDKTTILKLKVTQNFSKSVPTNFSQIFKFLVYNYPNYQLHFAEIAFEKHPYFAHSQVRKKSEPLYLLKRVLLI